MHLRVCFLGHPTRNRGLLQFYPILDLQKTWPTEAAELPGVTELARDRDRIAVDSKSRASRCFLLAQFSPLAAALLSFVLDSDANAPVVGVVGRR